MDDGSLVKESSDEKEVSPNNSDHDIQDKSEESREDPTTLGNPVIPSVRRDASEIHAFSPQALNVDQHDATSSRTDCQQNLLTEEKEANIHLSITSKASSAGLSQDSMTEKESSPGSHSSSVLPDAPERVPGSSKTAGLPTDKALGLNIDPTSNPQHYATEGYEPTTKMETDEVSSGKSENTQLTSNVAHPGTEIQMQESSQSRAIIENPHLPQSGSSAINAPGKELESDTHAKKEGTDPKPLESSTRTPKPNANSKLETEVSSKKENIEQLLGSLLVETLRLMNLPETKDTEVRNQYNLEEDFESLSATNLPEIQNPDISIQDNREVYLESFLTESLESTNFSKFQNSEGPRNPHTGSISTSRQRSEVGVDANPPQLDVHETGDSSSDQPSTQRNHREGSSEPNAHKEQPPTSGSQPISAEAISVGFPFNSSAVTRSGETRAKIIKWNNSDSCHSKYFLNIRVLLLEALKEIMAIDGEESRYREFEYLIHRSSESTSSDGEKNLLLKLCMYRAQMKTRCMVKQLISREDTLVHEILDKYESLKEPVTLALVNVLFLPEYISQFLLNTYITFKGTYERCSNTFKKYNESIKDEDSKERMYILIEKMERLLLLMRTAFQLHLIYIGENVDQEFIDRNVNHLIDGDEIYLRRRIV